MRLLRTRLIVRPACEGITLVSRLGFRILFQPNLDSGFQSLVGFRIPWAVLPWHGIKSCPCVPDQTVFESVNFWKKKKLSEWGRQPTTNSHMASTAGFEPGSWYSREACAQSKPLHRPCFQKSIINIDKLVFLFRLKQVRCENKTKVFSLIYLFYFATDWFLIYLPLSEARDWKPCPPPALFLQVNVDFIVHSNSTFYVELSTERHFFPLSKDHRVWREVNVLYLHRRATICSKKAGNK